MIKCVAIDDEPIALAILEEHCRNYGDMELKCFTSPVAGMECVESTHPDIVFLDIEMKSHNGLDLARSLPSGTCLIFTTAYSDYAAEGFNVDAVDFLQKPVFFPRFSRAVDKARCFMRGSLSSGRHITLKVEHKSVMISLADILFVEAMDNYVKVFRRNLPTVVSQITMKEMERILPQGEFLRVHRSFIVALASIESYSNRTLTLRDSGRNLPVGRKYIETFMKIFQPK